MLRANNNPRWHDGENAIYASYEVAHLIAKHSKPFSDGEFVRVSDQGRRKGYPGENGWF